MKVLLLNPPAANRKKFIREGRCTQEQGVWATLWPPVSLAMIGAVLERDSHDVRIIDCPARRMGLRRLRAEVRAFSPGLIIWSTGTPSIDGDLGLARILKETAPDIVTAVFGTHVTVLDRRCMQQFAHVDVIIRNEPEETARELAAQLDRGGSLSDIAGITFRDRSGRITAAPARPFIDDLDRLPFPAWHHITPGNYSLPMKGRPFLIVAPQRGCPFGCSFCTCQTYYGSKLRKQSVDRVVAEIAYDADRFGVRDFFFWSETFVLDKRYVADLCRALIRSCPDVSWTCNSRVDTVDEGLLKLMAQAGCWMISYGIESAEQEVLDRAGKGTTPDQARKAVAWARRSGIRTAGHFMFGLPGETAASMERTAAFSRELGLDLAQFYCSVPFPGSRLYELAERGGWVRDDDFSRFRQDSAVMELPTVDARSVDRCRSRAYRAFYCNPSVLLRLSSLLNYRSLRAAWETVRDFLGWSAARR